MTNFILFLFIPVGTFCEYKPDLETSFPTLHNCTKGFSDYFNTLNYTCASDSPTAGVLQWTPDDSTPNIVYYQVSTMFTHYINSVSNHMNMTYFYISYLQTLYSYTVDHLSSL